ncbi:HpcH/HpaI aldolase/citrate lyase family protein [Xylophilus rhododendri]|uniref:HpcH/HpaI aldolase/citrate lyase family protein n=1 Tax=Xylophilus rhododendri TaxID=2697032 RepID=A0A857J1A9_9BURK|nr:CoA ester lyase [Xylophilus rhododendri]QHI96665.1 HpcH/HpaI aldolase/citrate lyase family protein [Xylophilus rhododendri]
MRSKLFVPGSRPELFDKALAGDADALSFDLEDAVAESRKAEARQTLGDFLARVADPAVKRGKVMIVRVNPLDTPHFAPDLAAVVRPGLDLLNLPKPEEPAQVIQAVEALIQAERTNGVSQPVRLLLNIETPKALRNAAALAAAHPRVAGLQMGLGDLFEPLGIARRDPDNVRAAMFAIRMAAGEAGVFAYDGAFADVRDVEGYRAEADMARRLGFLGKSCIHPSQIALANAAFRPSDEEIAHARKVVDGARAAEDSGTGAWVVDGKMIDAPFLARARAIVETAVRLGLPGA